MLKPATDDPNAKKELARMKKDPKAFGARGAMTPLPKDWKPTELASAKEKTTNE